MLLTRKSHILGTKRICIYEGQSKDLSSSCLVSRLKKSDEQAFRSLVRYVSPAPLRLLAEVHPLFGRCQEVVQTTLIKLWQNRARLDAGRPLEPYLYRIAKTENLKYLQRVAHHHSQRAVMHQRMSPTTASPEQDTIFNEYQAIAARAIALLPPKRKLVYEMTHQQGKTVEEIATAMGVSSQTVRTQLTQALQSIRGYLKQHTDISFGVLLALLDRLF